MEKIDSLKIIQPDDWHIHLRDGEKLLRTVNDAALQFSRAIVMPNLIPPVLNANDATQYKKRILHALDSDKNIEPLMVIYLTDKTSPQIIKEAKESNVVFAAKYYPAGATTNSNNGVTDIKNIYPALEAMQKYDLVFAVHGEVTNKEIDIYDREAKFIENVLEKVTKDFPDLRIVFEHISTSEAVDFVSSSPKNIAATITAHHLLFNRNDMFAGGIRPHYYCLPVLKRNIHQQALIKAATSGNKKFFIGTDSAPHSKNKKESACGCAGAYTAHAAIELYAEAFDHADSLEKLEGFASLFGPDFYKLPRNKNSIKLTRQSWEVPHHLDYGKEQLTPLFAGQKLSWKIETT